MELAISIRFAMFVWGFNAFSICLRIFLFEWNIFTQGTGLENFAWIKNERGSIFLFLKLYLLTFCNIHFRQHCIGFCNSFTRESRVFFSKSFRPCCFNFGNKWELPRGNGFKERTLTFSRIGLRKLVTRNLLFFILSQKHNFSTHARICKIFRYSKKWKDD